MGKKIKDKERDWVMLALSERSGLSKFHKQVRREINEKIGYDSNVFLPHQVKKVASKLVPVLLFDGYAFVQDDGKDDFEDRVKDSAGGTISKVLTGSRGISYVSNKEIDRYKEALEKLVYSYTPTIGELVEGTEGVFKKLEGIVVDVNSEAKTADVQFKMLTREVLAKGLTFIALAPK